LVYDDFVVQWSLLLPIATIAANPASDVVAVFTQDAQCKFVYHWRQLLLCIHSDCSQWCFCFSNHFIKSTLISLI